MKTFGYYVKCNNESHDDAIAYYSNSHGGIDDLHKSKRDAEAEIPDVFANVDGGSVQLYKLVAVPVGKPIKRKKRK